jgi:hypothetical protein
MGDDDEDDWDETVEESFPASDPPAWGGSIGGPQDPADAAKRSAPPGKKKVAVEQHPGGEPDGELHPDRRR